MLSAAAIDIRNLNRQLMSTVFMLCAVLLASGVVSAQEPGADGLGDNLYPQLGNGGYDVRHYTIDLAFIPRGKPNRRQDIHRRGGDPGPEQLQSGFAGTDGRAGGRQ